jgi:hypothetical protein
MNDKEYTWAELLGAGVGIVIFVVFVFFLSAVLMIIPAWIVHWILVNLFNYTVLTLWQVWGIIVGVRMIFSGLVTINKN